MSRSRTIRKSTTQHTDSISTQIDAATLSQYQEQRRGNPVPTPAVVTILLWKFSLHTETS
ncbi:Protein I'm not dead yet [Frankliniella fusca]|uniref:Protein I'm not dead yet n=1 Tax=Frankliniella fusca TaxID=407009 RepID=A0AAE1L8V8_9NEOP|nr:Protein I'm not dead yet [Frankliniella fusca]